MDERRVESPHDLGRGVATILVVGVALGVAFNAFGLYPKPAWGLPWVGVDRVAELPKLDALPATAPTRGYAANADPMAVGAASDGAPEIPDLDRPIQIDLAAVKQLYDAGQVFFVDAREHAEYAAGHIPGAVSLPYDDVASEPERLEHLETGGKPIVAYCGGGSCELSLSLAWDLINAGHSRVTVYMGGFPEWAAAGFPVEGDS